MPKTDGRLMFALLAAVAAAGPFARAQSVPDDGALARAVRIAGGSEAELRRFHASYQLEGDGAVQSIEIVTPYRRAVAAASARRGKATIDEMRASIRAHGPGPAVRAVVRLDPRHTFVRPPDYSIVLLAGDDRIDPSAVQRLALGPRGVVVPSLAIGGDASMTAVQVEAQFPAGSFERRGCCRVAVLDAEGNRLVTRALPQGLR